MLTILKNPIILAVIVGIVVFILTSYYTKDENKKSKRRQKNKKKVEAQSRETAIIIAAIASLGTWFLAYTYLDNSDNSSETNTSDSDLLNMTKQTGGGSHGKHSMNKGKIASITSEEAVRSYNLLGSGLNIPKSELKIPNVLIDYN